MRSDSRNKRQYNIQKLTPYKRSGYTLAKKSASLYLSSPTAFDNASGFARSVSFAVETYHVSPSFGSSAHAMAAHINTDRNNSDFIMVTFAFNSCDKPQRQNKQDNENKVA